MTEQEKTLSTVMLNHPYSHAKNIPPQVQSYQVF